MDLFGRNKKYAAAAVAYLETEIWRHMDKEDVPLYSIDSLFANVDFSLRTGLISTQQAFLFRNALNALRKE